MFVTLSSLLMLAVLFEDASIVGRDAVLCGEQFPMSRRP